MTNKKWCLALVLLTCSVLLSEDYANSVSPDKRHIRCGTSLFQHNLKNKETGSYFSREVIVRSARHAASLRYSVSKKSGATPLRYLSPSGKFPIYYNFPADSAVPDSDAVTLTPSGTWINSPNGIPDYIEWVAQAADTSYWLMRDTLGYEDSSV
jgi:hypothetical protein